MMSHIAPEDLHSGLPESFYYYESLRNGYKNFRAIASEDALEAFHAFRDSHRRSDAKAVYRCDTRNACLLLEIVQVDDLYILYLPENRVSRSEAARIGSALRIYYERACWFSAATSALSDERGVTRISPPTLYGEIELMCRHYILDVFSDAILTDTKTGKVSRFLPGSATRPSGIEVVNITDRWDAPDYDQSSWMRWAKPD